MLEENILIQGGKAIVSLAWEILYFPVWWYSAGFWLQAKRSWRFLANGGRTLGVAVWLKNIFVPMYGQTDFAGRAISFVIRFLQVVVRGAAWLCLLVLAFSYLCFWLLLPLLLILLLSFHLRKAL